MPRADAEGPERVLVTGASSGIGLATARRYAARGARVALVARSVAVLDREAARLPGAISVPADVRDRAAIERAVEQAAARLGGLDVVVVNAGAAAYGPFRDTDPEDFHRVVATTFQGAVDTVRAALPHLERSAGAMVVVGSAADSLPLPLQSAYVASKHALRGFAETLSIELAAEGSRVAVSLVSPGPVATPFWDNVASQGERLPPRMPIAYHPDEVARSIIRAAEKRSGGLTIGGLTVLVRAAHTAARPVTRRVLAAATRALPRFEREGTGRAAIREPAGAGEVRGDMPARPSALVRARELAGAAGRALARR